jgi:hypothetical protein
LAAGLVPAPYTKRIRKTAGSVLLREDSATAQYFSICSKPIILGEEAVMKVGLDSSPLRSRTSSKTRNELVRSARICLPHMV